MVKEKIIRVYHETLQSRYLKLRAKLLLSKKSYKQWAIEKEIEELKKD